MSDSDEKNQKEKPPARQKSVLGVLANAARTTGKAGSTKRGQTMLELRCKQCGAPRTDEQLFTCAFCGASLV